ncbi:MAG: ATP-binding cassette domain-containing protein, partial [Steroidobacteraceae bacterium]
MSTAVEQTTAGALALQATDLHYSFRRRNEAPTQALAGVSLEVHHGELTALIGPDGAGKTTLMRLSAGLLRPDSGSLRVLGFNVPREPQRVQDLIGYMPQRFGLYEDLSVAENIDLYAELHGVTSEQRAQRYPQLMSMTALAAFRTRLAGQLSGGMKQKLGLACALIRSPQLLLLDEPTVGVDPLSRRELWEIVRQLVAEQGLTVLLSTAYLDEAERCNRVVLLNQGKVLAAGTPAEITRHAAGLSFITHPAAAQSARALQAQLLDQPDIIDAVPDAGRVRFVRSAERSASGRTDELLKGLTVEPVAASFEDGFMVLLRRTAEAEPVRPMQLDRPVPADDVQQVVRVRGLFKRFGAFTAVDHIDFDVRRGEIFGLLGPNGAGKTTTFRMLCGLLTPSGGELQIAGTDVRRAPAAARQRLGYVAQKFSLYGPLSVTENLEFFASAYGLRGARRRARIDWALRQFELEPQARAISAQLPGGFKQRLAIAAALLHE